MTAVAFLVFNRPDCTRQTLAEIRRARPTKLFVVADGPREGHPTDVSRCEEVRRLVNEGVDWPCDVLRNYSDANLGCAARVASGLNWAFSLSEELIVIEDDCLPDPSFFRYCEELLRRYRNDTRIGQICGTPLITAELKRESSYIFSRYGPIWGWASWRRAWDYYDLELKNWPKMRAARGLRSVVQSDAELQWRMNLYDSLHAGPPITWDFQWGYAKLTQSLLSIIPCRNLVANIGFSVDATHTIGRKTGFAHHTMDDPILHPKWVLPDPDFDRSFSRRYSISFATRVRQGLARLRYGVRLAGNAIKAKGGR
jgi:hypothetical protein